MDWHQQALYSAFHDELVQYLERLVLRGFQACRHGDALWARVEDKGNWTTIPVYVGLPGS